jgi:hypothetical protein
VNYKKSCDIKIWYWNYRDKDNRYSQDNKKIHFEILQNNERQMLLNYQIPKFLDGNKLVDEFLASKFATLSFLPSLNYNQDFNTYSLKEELINLIKGDCDYRVFD